MGHVERSHAFELEKGTSVYAFSKRASSMAHVQVRGGYHDGEDCWLPAGALE